MANPMAKPIKLIAVDILSTCGCVLIPNAAAVIVT